jgi:hypothetical protein
MINVMYHEGHQKQKLRRVDSCGGHNVLLAGYMMFHKCSTMKMLMYHLLQRPATSL